MDSLTISIMQINVPWLTTIASFLDKDIIMLFVTAVFVLISEQRKEKLIKIVFAVLLAIVLSVAVKELVKSSRPCETLPSKIPCGEGYSFPSTHAIIVFTIMLSFLNKPVFILYFLYAIFVAFTRIYLGMHSFEDVVGSSAFAPFVYYITDQIWRKFGWNLEWNKLG